MKFTLLFIVLVSFSNIYKADIPTHCLKSQEVGTWEFKATKTVKKSLADLYQFSCGHQIPSHENTALKFNMDMQTFTEKFTIELRESDEAIYKDANISEQTGSWSMVYDEGFDIVFNKNKPDYRSYFIFLKYGLNNNFKGVTSKWASYCYSTLIGWYHVGDEWGCFYGTKVGTNSEEVTNGEAGKKQVVLEGTITQKVFMQHNENEVSNENNNNDDYYNNINNETRFMESKFTTQLTLTTEFKDHAKVVERINDMELSWKAENYIEFENMTLEQLNKFAGRKKYKNFSDNSSNNVKKHNYNNHSKANKKNFLKIKKTNTQVVYPESFTWMEYMSEPKSQGNCGSCFAAATITMLEARIRIKYKDLILKYFGDFKNFGLSYQHVVDCSVYNQGCDGGYSVLVSKFAQEYDLLPNSCYTQSSPVKCNVQCIDPKISKLKFGVDDYYYTGGSYGKSNEENLMKELYENGPVVVSFEPHYSFMMYKSGVYDINAVTWMKSNISKPEWQKVDHSVVLVGWGVEKQNGKDIKYWILQNSWGKHWGENGYLKFKRGVDLLGVESIGEVGIPYVKEN